MQILRNRKQRKENVGQQLVAKSIEKCFDYIASHQSASYARTSKALFASLSKKKCINIEKCYSFLLQV